MNRLLLSASILLIVFLTGGLIYLHWSSDSNTKSLQGLSIEVEEGSVKVTNGKGEINLAAGERGVSEPGVPPLVVAQSTPDSEEMKEPDSTPVTPIAATLALSSSTSSEPTIESVTKESYWISGYVLNEDGEYLAKSQISCTRRINGKDKPAGKTVSNEEGYYALEVPGTGFYRLTSSPSNEYFDKTDSTSLDEETKTAAVNFLHEKGAHILRGRVIAKNSGEPIANAEVKLMDYKYNPSAVSGEDGRFVIHNLVEGTYNFRASAEGYMDYDARQRRFQEIADPLAGIKISKDIQLKEYTIKMEDAGAVTVYVVDANQSPVPSTSVTAIPYGDEHDDTHKRADSNGVCAFTNIPPGKVLFQARKDEYGETFSEVVETGNLDSPTEVTIALSASSSISGQIVYKDGPPAAGWEIFVSNASAGTIMEKGGIHSAKIETDDSGNYTIPDLGKGEYKLFLFKHDQEGTHKVFTDRIIALEIGEHKTGVNYEIIEGTETVSGKVIAQDGSPIPGAEVEIHAAGSGDPNTIFTEGFNITDENGEFSVEKILKKRGMMISVSADAYKPFRDGFQMGEYVTITLSPASIIAGIVLDQSTRQPIPGANVILRTKYGRDKAEVTDTNGAF